MENQLRDNSDLVLSNKVLEMVTVAHEYCLFVEKISKYNKTDIQMYFSKIAPLLYLKASLLPDIEVSDNDADERFVTEEAWNAIYNDTKEIFKEDNIFADTDNIEPADTELFHYEISEIVADIYQDLKDFVMLYQKESLAAKENAVFSCRNYFKNNWGIKCIFLMKTMHVSLYENDINKF